MNKDNFELLRNKTEDFRYLPILKEYYLVLGGGNIGHDFVEYAKKHNYPFVLVLDMDENAPASRDSIVIDRIGLFAILQNLKQLGHDAHSASGVTRNVTSPEGIYFHCMDVRDIYLILNYGVPEYLIPAIPSHALVNMVVDFLKYDNGYKLVDVLEIDDDDREKLVFFEDIKSHFPEEIIAFCSHKHGVIFLSYAKKGEICPLECEGLSDHCYTFDREKPETITAYSRKLSSEYVGWVFESWQVKPGIGGIYGTDFKSHLIDIMAYVRKMSLDEKASSNGVFFIVTSCNCHGILNLLYSM